MFSNDYTELRSFLNRRPPKAEESAAFSNGVKELRGRIVLLTRMKKIKIIEMPAIIEFYS
ncbi:MAG TPA: hypothetical protein DHU69_01100 [Deltaproteobacteria bacterium]|nr:MAG: hypothetical protein A2067_08025 [Deltaproteobacteria bacterium GWB2_42_7]OGP43396.1 MAG: hypothetical protein A2090_04010 [Deltaproteobacteria bacterium GWD2_42_10]OGP46135.1 MAG: hypothetical protein A2022_01040 [Deltaproteobacteria bacterium GWF2_42_12]OGQ24648.1 MAG: hypothetical protein A3D29_00085 [Deltaproteobacteria bacterium RIFCSPHIGHO2_02_FULL_42_44]OGQ69173.1 MAG: hypothetical protein A3F88_10790 [Deltaproteobacteria bacterium RIFCSPLOWO2_12_FULL_42_16]OGQ71991.1 MAG: hypot